MKITIDHYTGFAEPYFKLPLFDCRPIPVFNAYWDSNFTTDWVLHIQQELPKELSSIWKQVAFYRAFNAICTVEFTEEQIRRINELYFKLLDSKDIIEGHAII